MPAARGRAAERAARGMVGKGLRNLRNHIKVLIY